jgi:hypothetical protein
MYFQNIKKQCGTTMFFSLVFMLGMVAMIGLATTTGRLVTDKTTLQNALDAAALSAAITINDDISKNTANATAKGRATFDLFKAAAGNGELSGVDATDLTFEYSRNLNPFVAETTPPTFVRVSTSALEVPPILLQFLDAFKTPINIGAVSTAGAVGQNCTLTPFVLCAKNPSDNKCDKDDYISDGTVGEDGIDDCWGFNMGTELNLIQPSCNNPNNCTIDTSTSLESGNFNLIDLDGMQGGKDIRTALTNETRFLCTSNDINTKPGYTWGNVRMGIDDRYDSDTDLRDTITYPTYQAEGLGNERRVMAVSVANCAGIQNGNTTVPKLGTICMFLRDRASDVSHGSDKKVVAELSYSCEQAGVWDPTQVILNGPHDVVLFKSQGSGDS